MRKCFALLIQKYCRHVSRTFREIDPIITNARLQGLIARIFCFAVFLRFISKHAARCYIRFCLEKS